MHESGAWRYNHKPGSGKPAPGKLAFCILTVTDHPLQFSLIDLRPLFGMVCVCQKHNLKLLTYGTLVSDTTRVGYLANHLVWRFFGR